MLMRSTHLASILAILVACGSSTGSPDASRGLDSNIQDATPDTMFDTLSGTVFDNDAQAPIANASVCIPSTPFTLCTTTDGSGSWTLQVASGSMREYFALELTATGYAGEAYFGFVQPGAYAYVSEAFLIPDARETTFLHTQAGFTYPSATTGFIALRAGVNEVTGVVATLAPASGTGPVYLDAMGVPTPSLTGTTTSGAVLFGNVAPGHYNITATANGQPCTSMPANTVIVGDLPPDGTATVGVDVFAGAISDNLTVSCP